MGKKEATRNALRALANIIEDADIEASFYAHQSAVPDWLIADGENALAELARAGVELTDDHTGTWECGHAIGTGDGLDECGLPAGCCPICGEE